LDGEHAHFQRDAVVTRPSRSKMAKGEKRLARRVAHGLICYASHVRESAVHSGRHREAPTRLGDPLAASVAMKSFASQRAGSVQRDSALRAHNARQEMSHTSRQKP
jgi:hypothetical protein